GVRQESKWSPGVREKLGTANATCHYLCGSRSYLGKEAVVPVPKQRFANSAKVWQGVFLERGEGSRAHLSTYFSAKWRTFSNARFRLLHNQGAGHRRAV